MTLAHRHFFTPCGFEIYLIRTKAGMEIRSRFNGQPASFVNGDYSLSDKGAEMLGDKINELFGKD